MAHLEEYRSRSAPGSAARSVTPARPQRWRAHAWRALPALIVLLALAGWEASVSAGLVSRLLFPAPSTIAASAWKLTQSGTLPAHFAATMSRVLLGLFFGGTAGLLLGLGAGMVKPLRLVLEPFVAALHPIPKIAIFPLLMVFFGLGETSKLVLTSTAAFFPVLINTLAGVRQVPTIYYDVARNYGASHWLTVWRVILPGSLPFILSGVILAFNLTLLVTIAVEMIHASTGLGQLIWLAWQTMRTEEVYVSLAVIVAVGVLSNYIFRFLSRRLAPWQAGR